MIQRAMARADAETHGSPSPDPGPDRTASAERNRLQRQAKAHETRGERRNRDQAWPQPREAVGMLEPESPRNFEKSCEEEREPGHSDSPRLVERRAA
jgi:hypothetical protein